MEQLEDVKTKEELWRTIENSDKKSDWYGASVNYWDKQEASVNGVLGGYGHVSDDDIDESRKFLVKAFRNQLKQAEEGKRRLVAIDCGAGVGRVTENLLLQIFHEVDLLEPSKHLISKAQERLGGNEVPMPKGHKLGNLFHMGLQQFTPEFQRYDVIWIQWALLYLTDGDAIGLFNRCKQGLKKDGLIIVKENICSKESEFVVDKDDMSVTRSHDSMLKLFADANMQLLYSAKQKKFPKELFAVQMYAVKPKVLNL